MSFETIIPLSIIETIGDFALEKFANKGGLLPLSLGLSSYMGVVYFLIRALKGSSVLLVNGAWDGISGVMESVAAYVFLGERFTNYNQYIGILFIMIGMYLLKIPWKKNNPFHIPKL